MTDRVGVDLGGTKIEVVRLGPGGEENARQRVPTPAGDYEGILHAIRELVDGVWDAAAAPTVGIGTPGTVSPARGVMKNANSVVLNGKPLDRDLAEALGRPIVMANDADCFTLSEAVDGAAAGAAVVFGAILGTGVGGGIAVDGGLRTGPNRVAGEWGHNPLPWGDEAELQGPDCYCGRQGCIETWLSGGGFADDHRRATGAEMSSVDIVEAARRGDPDAVATLGRYVDRLARSLATIINLLDPDVVVLGGGMSNVDELYDLVPGAWGDWVFGREVATRLVRNLHGDSSGVRGAAMLVSI